MTFPFCICRWMVFTFQVFFGFLCDLLHPTGTAESDAAPPAARSPSTQEVAEETCPSASCWGHGSSAFPESSSLVLSLLDTPSLLSCPTMQIH